MAGFILIIACLQLSTMGSNKNLTFIALSNFASDESVPRIQNLAIQEINNDPYLLRDINVYDITIKDDFFHQKLKDI